MLGGCADTHGAGSPNSHLRSLEWHVRARAVAHVAGPTRGRRPCTASGAVRGSFNRRSGWKPGTLTPRQPNLPPRFADRSHARTNAVAAYTMLMVSTSAYDLDHFKGTAWPWLTV